MGLGKVPSKKIRKQCEICGKTIVDPPTSLVDHKALVHKDPDSIALKNELDNWKLLQEENKRKAMQN